MRTQTKICLALLTLSTSGAFGLGSAGFREAATGKARLLKGDARLAKLSGSLLSLIHPGRFKGIPGLRFSLQESDDPLEIEIRMERMDEATLRDIESLGWEIVKAHPSSSRVIAAGPRILLEDLASMEAVAAVDLNRPPMVFGAGSSGDAGTGFCLSQADVWMRALQARSDRNVSGGGVKIGIISDSFRSRLGGVLDDGKGCQRGFAPENNVGELPDSIFLLEDGRLGDSDEGRALAELIHDLAPDAEIYFHGGADSIAGMAGAVTALAECGVDIIVDDLLFPGEPMFEDGLIARRVQAAANGEIARADEDRPEEISYFSAAGNLWTLGLEDTLADSETGEDQSFPATGADFHQFDSGSAFARLRLPPGFGVQAVLQWDEPFSDSGPGASTDLDLYLCNSEDAGDCTFAAAGAQGCGAGRPDGFGDPIEILDPFVNTRGSAITVYLAVDHFCGNSDNLPFRLSLTEVGRSSPDEDGVDRLRLEVEPEVFDGPQIYGHAAAAGAIAVAAVDYREISSGGSLAGEPSKLDVQPFSSQGGLLAIRSARDGPQEEAEKRSKPDLAAADRTDTSFFSRLEPDWEGNGCPNFSGTSAAAAHAAAVAALMLQLRPDFTPEDVRRALTFKEDPDGVDPDLDAVTPLAGGPERGGAGLIDAFNALRIARDTLEAPLDLEGSQPLWAPPVLRWSPVDGATGYLVEWEGRQNESGRQSSATTDTSLILTGLRSGVYRWRVSAFADPDGVANGLRGLGVASGWKNLELAHHSWRFRR